MIAPSPAPDNAGVPIPQPSSGQRSRRAFQRIALPLALSLIAVLSSGCASWGAPRGEVRLQSAADAGRAMQVAVEPAYYAFDGRNHITLVAPQARESEAEAGVVVVAEMFWEPRAARTPISPRATNATVRVFVFAGEHAGVYQGAGFMYPVSTPGGERLALEIWDSVLELGPHTARFKDLLGSTIVRGEVVAQRDDARAQAMARQVEVRAAKRLR